jgi:hypothetical protein
MGLWTYHWLAQQVGDSSEATWAASQYISLLAATSKTLNATISANHLNYLPCSMTEPNTGNRCANAEDANWAAPFLFGRWAWDGSLFGAPLSGPGVSLTRWPPSGQTAAWWWDAACRTPGCAAARPSRWLTSRPRTGGTSGSRSRAAARR